MGLGDGTDGKWNTLARMYLWPFRLAFRPQRAAEGDAALRDATTAAGLKKE
jgi:hypothetical protein